MGENVTDLKLRVSPNNVTTAKGGGGAPIIYPVSACGAEHIIGFRRGGGINISINSAFRTPDNK